MTQLLLIEDDQVFATTLARRLSKHGLSVAHAEDASAALLMARQLSPEAILLDMHLDGDSGLNLITPIRNVLPDTKIVLLTGYASIATAVDAIKLGADDYLAKPADINTILAAIGVEDKKQTSVEEDAKPLSAEQAEWEHLQQVLKTNQGNISAAARQLSMHRRTLQRKLKKRPNNS